MNESSSSSSSSSSFLVEHQSNDAADSTSSTTTTAAAAAAAAAAATAMITGDGELPPSPPGEPAIRSPPSVTTAIDSSSSYSPSSSSSMTSKIKIAETSTATLTTAKKLHQKQPSGKHVTDLLLLPDDGDDDEHDHNDDEKNGIGTSNNNNNNNNNGRIIPNGVSWNSADSQQNSNENNNNNNGNSNHDNSSSSSSNNGSNNNAITNVDDNFIISKNTNNRNHSPSRITYATTSAIAITTTESSNTSTQGRRSITLRLHERIDSISTPPNPNSSHSTNNAASFVSISSSPLLLSSVRSLRRFRSMSLSGLPFANVVNAAVQAEEAADGKSFGTTTTATDDSAAAANHGDEKNDKEHHPLLSSSSNNNSNSNPNGDNKIIVDRGIITVSWYEGTTTTEMSDHVYNCVLRRLNSERSRRRRQQNKTGAVGERDRDEGKLKLEDVRLIDETVTPHGEVVLCPFLPDGSSFVLQFKTSIDKPPPPPSTITPSNAMINGSVSTSSNSLRALPSLPPWYASRAPESPSAEPRSPYLINNGHQSYSDYLIQHQSHRAVQHQQIQTQQLLSAVAALLQKQHQQQQQHSVSGGGGNVVVSSQQMNSNGIGPTMVPNITSVAEEEEEEESAPPTKEWKSAPTATTSQEDGDGDDDDDDDEVGQEEEDSMSFNSPIKLSSNALRATTLGSSSTISAMNTHAENSTTTNVTSSGATETAALTTDQLIEQQLRQLNELFLLRKLTSGLGEEGNIAVDVGGDGKSGNAVATMDDDDQAHLVRAYYRAEKKQVIFVIANYFVLFLSLIALSAEIQSRLPQWMDWVQQNYDSVQNCATDQGALIECLSNGDFSGLVASFLLWATQSASAKRIFLFGFDTPKKLWTVVYEALVTAVCWGMSYLFIRRGLNPNTRQNFIQIYWKDAVYGSLAGFNAAFMKAVLKNLIPQEVALEALEGRQLRIRHWLLSLMED